MIQKRSIIITLIIFWSVCIFLTINKHKKSGYFNYHSELWSDKAGYNVYLPAFFIYHFSADNFPDNIDQKTGSGFLLDQQSNKVITKYPYGVSLLQLPFFLAAHLLSKPLGYLNDGYSPPYQKVLDISAAFYLGLAFLFLFNFLLKYFQFKNSLFVLFLIFAGTNLYWYGLDEGGLSHVYSFFLFSVLLFLLTYEKNNSARSKNINQYTAIVLSLICIVRPIDFILAFPLLFLNTSSINQLISGIKNNFTLKSSLSYLLIFFIIVLPQLMYYEYLSGNFILDTYVNESFSNLRSPKIIEVWAAPENGLFLYNPILIFTIIGAVFMCFKKNKNGIICIFVFLMVTLTYATWYSWHLGCSYGHRGFVEYYALLSLPLGYFIQHLNALTIRSLRMSIYLILLFFVVYNMKLIYTYDNCWFGKNSWDWNEYSRLVFSNTK